MCHLGTKYIPFRGKYGTNVYKGIYFERVVVTWQFFFSDSVQTTPPYSDCTVTYKQLKDLMFNVYTVHVCAKFIIYVNIIVTFAEPTCNYKCNYIVTLLLKLCNVI